MTLEEVIQARLVASTAVTALVPVERIRVRANYYELELPYIVHFPAIGENTIHTHSGRAALRTWDRYQVTVVTELYAQGRAIADKVRDALDGYSTAAVHRIAHSGTTPIKFDYDQKLIEFAVRFEIGEALA